MYRCRGSDLVLSGDNVATGGNDDSVSSAATSATREEMTHLVSELGSSLRTELDQNISARFKFMNDTFLEAMNRRFDMLDNNNQFLSAPLPASVRPQPVEVRPDTSHLTL